MAGNASLDSVAPLPVHRPHRPRVERLLRRQLQPLGRRGNSYGVRPVLIFNSCLSVSWQDGEEESEPNEAAQKEELWADYIYYLSEWNEEHTGANNYGSSPMSFAEWLESRCEREDDEE